MSDEIKTIVKFHAVHSIELTDADGNCLGSALVANYHNGVSFYRLHVRPAFRRRGYAGQIVAELVRVFGQMPIYLIPEPFDDSPMSQADLVRFYRKRGFELLNDEWFHGDTMARPGDSIEGGGR